MNHIDVKDGVEITPKLSVGECAFSIVTHYSKRYLTVLATIYWSGKIPFSHKRKSVFSSQKVHDLIGCRL